MDFNTTNVQKAVCTVKTAEIVGIVLGVPGPIRRKISQLKSLDEQQEAYIKYFIENDPEASWRAVIVGLDRVSETKAADAIRHLAEPVTGRVDRSTIGNQ